MGRYDDIYRKAALMEVGAERCRFINKSIQRRYEGFWLFWWNEFKQWIW